jgi:hypothetical protein
MGDESFIIDKIYHILFTFIHYLNYLIFEQNKVIYRAVLTRIVKFTSAPKKGNFAIFSSFLIELDLVD